MKNQIAQLIRSSIELKQTLLSDAALLDRTEQAARCMVEALRQGRRIYFCGNGGSAADAQHLAAELSGRFYTDRKALPAEALHCNSSYLTAVANDYGYEQVYARLIEGITQPGDVVIGLSTSGNSANIIEGFQAARRLDVKTIGMTGAGGGRLREWTDILLDMPSRDTPRIQEAHILIGHILCQIVEEQYFAP